jgi:anti-sigma regulatory factor (Ser/Thr protein kinase)
MILAPIVASASAARAFVRDAFATWAGAPDVSSAVVEDAALVASELVTNAIIHGGHVVKLAVRFIDECVEISVADDLLAHPTRVAPSPERAGGQGLNIVGHLAVDWGTEDLVGGKRVWCRLRLRPESSD